MTDIDKRVALVDVDLQIAQVALDRAMRRLSEPEAMAVRSVFPAFQEFAGTVQTAIDAVRRAKGFIDVTRPGPLSTATEETTPPFIQCPNCGRWSYNENDIREKYCGECHQYYADMEITP
jgi:hypothetical protein